MKKNVIRLKKCYSLLIFIDIYKFSKFFYFNNIIMYYILNLNIIKILKKNYNLLFKI